MLEWNLTEYGELTREIVPGQVTLEILGKTEASELAEGMEIPGVYGDPEAASRVWHMQEHPMSCAVVCQEYIAEELLGRDFSEARMRDYAEERDWFDDHGTALWDVGNLLAEMGLDVERTFDADLNDLKEVLSDGGKIIVAVNNMTLHSPLYALIPGSTANHAVEVTGIDERDPAHVKVILNDSGVTDGAGREIPLRTFLAAWEKSECCMVSVYRRKDGAAI